MSLTEHTDDLPAPSQQAPNGFVVMRPSKQNGSAR